MIIVRGLDKKISVKLRYGVTYFPLKIRRFFWKIQNMNQNFVSLLLIQLNVGGSRNSKTWVTRPFNCWSPVLAMNFSIWLGSKWRKSCGSFSPLPSEGWHKAHNKAVVTASKLEHAVLDLMKYTNDVISSYLVFNITLVSFKSLRAQKLWGREGFRF